jgi:5-methylcytosine-specific restriction protein B
MPTNLVGPIRKYVTEQYITPARQRGDKTVRICAGDVHKEMGFYNSDSRFPSICSAIDRTDFLEELGVTIQSRTGPNLGSSVEWILRLD